MHLVQHVITFSQTIFKPLWSDSDIESNLLSNSNSGTSTDKSGEVLNATETGETTPRPLSECDEGMHGIVVLTIIAYTIAYTTSDGSLHIP